MRRRTAAAEPREDEEPKEVDSRGYDLSKRRGRRPGQKAKTPPARVNQEVKTPAQQVAELEQIRIATRLKLGHQTYAAIAAHLGVSQLAVASLVRKGLEEYRRDNKEFIADQVSLAIARSERFMRAWDQAAHGYRREDGTEVAPDPKAARIYQGALAEHTHLLGLASIKVEHGGPGGGPIPHAHLHVNFDFSRLSDEQLARAQSLVGSEQRAFLAGLGAIAGDGVPAPEGDPE